MAIALDTNALSALLDGDTKLINLLAPHPRLSFPVTVLGEFRYGIARSQNKKKLGQLLTGLENKSEVLDINLETTHYYASIRNQLRNSGTPIPENDIWIASLCIQHDIALITRDQHYSLIENQTVISW